LLLLPRRGQEARRFIDVGGMGSMKRTIEIEERKSGHPVVGDGMGGSGVMGKTCSIDQ